MLAVVWTVCFGVDTVAQHWPAWRGPTHDGVSTEKGLPDTWSATCATPATPGGPDTSGPSADAAEQFPRRPRPGGGNFEGRPLVPTVCANIETRNVAWRLPLPAYSGSTPIVWGDMIFLNVATAANTGELELWAVDRRTGSVAWKRPLADTNHMERKQNMSSPSPVTDGRHVWVMTGVGILKAFDFDGNELWSRSIQDDYGPFGLNWGYASSPLLKDGALYVQVLHGMKTDDPSYVMRIDKKSGKTVWKVDRPTTAIRESPDSYTTPALLRYGKNTEIVITGDVHRSMWSGLDASPSAFSTDTSITYCPSSSSRVRPPRPRTLVPSHARAKNAVGVELRLSVEPDPGPQLALVEQLGGERADRGVQPPGLLEKEAAVGRDRGLSVEQVLEHGGLAAVGVRALQHLAELLRVADEHGVARAGRHRARVGERDLARLVDDERVDPGGLHVVAREQPGRAREQEHVVVRTRGEVPDGCHLGGDAVEGAAQSRRVDHRRRPAMAARRARSSASAQISISSAIRETRLSYCTRAGSSRE